MTEHHIQKDLKHSLLRRRHHNTVSSLIPANSSKLLCGLIVCSLLLSLYTQFSYEDQLSLHWFGPRTCSFKAQNVPGLSIFVKVVQYPVVLWADIGESVLVVCVHSFQVI